MALCLLRIFKDSVKGIHIFKFFDSDESFEWKNANHYFVPVFYLWVGFDPFSNGWVG